MSKTIGAQIHELHMLAAGIGDDKNDLEDKLIEIQNAIEAIAEIFDEFHDALAPLGR